MTAQRFHFDLYVSSFCGACARTRSVLEVALRVLPACTIHEHDVAFERDRTAVEDVSITPATIIRDAAGAEIYRAVGTPTIDQVLTEVARLFVEPDQAATEGSTRGDRKTRQAPTKAPQLP